MRDRNWIHLALIIIRMRLKLSSKNLSSNLSYSETLLLRAPRLSIKFKVLKSIDRFSTVGNGSGIMKMLLLIEISSRLFAGRGSKKGSYLSTLMINQYLEIREIPTYSSR